MPAKLVPYNSQNYAGTLGLYKPTVVLDLLCYIAAMLDLQYI